jgi:hypothetical protein
MSPEEAVARESIRHTLARYTIAGDRLRVEDFVAVFTDDAILESEGVSDADSFHYRGRDAIAEWLGRWQSPTSEPVVPTHSATFVRHHLATSLVEFTGPDTAKARTYWSAYTDIGPDHCGVYLDSLRRSAGETGDEWLIAHRRVRLDWRSPDSLFTTAITRTR